ncbi:MAG: methyltransferase domain-containing protein [Bacteroidales bacterium]|nr:methyltransferase domain-containing protein [Bacteroidales bacterium]
MRLKKKIPYFIRIISLLINLLQKNFYVSIHKKDKFCPVCDKKSYFKPIDEYFLKQWQKYQFQYSIFCFETYNIVEYSCCNCNANDRYRLIALYLKYFFEYKNAEYHLLEVGFSPFTFNIIKALNKRKKIIYYILDKYYTKADFINDIENCKQLKDNFFDIIICSHILEHLENPVNAIKEIYRILKFGGIAIFLAPILTTIEKTIENSEYKTPALRWKYFGQNDHLRIFSKTDFINLLSIAPFSISQLDVNYFGTAKFNEFGIDERSILYVCKKI